MSSSFNQNLQQICARALRLLGAIQSGETPDAGMVTDCTTALNAMTKEWEASGIHVWAETQGVLFLQPGQNQYALGPTTTDSAATQATITSLAATASAGSSTFSLLNPEVISAGDKVGIVLDAGNVFWTVAGTASASATVNTVMAIPSQASAGNAVFSYPLANQLPRPLRVLELRRRWLPSGYDTPLGPVARLDYYALPNKMQTGTINQWFYDPQLGNGIMRVWQPPIGPIREALLFTFMRQIDDWASPANTGDFPQEWVNAITYNLAVEIGPEFDVDPRRMQFLVAQAQDKKQTAMDWDREPESIYFGVAMEPWYR